MLSKAKQRLLHGFRGGISAFTLTMTSTRLPPPGEFNFSKPDEWPKWRRRFEQYRGASGLDAESESRQVDTLLYCLGDEADSVLASMNISSDDKKKYEKVIEKFDSYFRVRRNVIFERERFNRRSQKEGESSEQYITELYNLIEFCEYGTGLSEKLQTDPDLTLTKKEAAREHRRELQEDSKKESSLCRVSGRFPRRPPAGRGRPQSTSRAPKGGTSSQCSKCGKPQH